MDLAQIAAASAASGKARCSNGFTLDGVFIEFSFEPYDCQKEYMSKVLLALREGKNALLESPTGTGKTLCLLCACLAWRESLKGGGMVHGGQDPSGGIRVDPQPMAPAGPALPPQPSRAPHDQNMPNALIDMLYSERNNHLNPSAPGQPNSDPSSSGANGSRPSLPTIIYSSRTHGQLAQVMKELRGTSYADRVQSTVLASRQQTCIHPQVSKMSNGSMANNACRSLVSKRKCNFHNQLKYGAKAKEREWASQASIPDIEDLVTIGRNHTVCPFFLSKELCKDADIIFMPYNYLLDPNARKALVDQVKWEDAIIIFDEAHNVESVCSDASSFDITAKHLADAMVEARRIRESCLEQLERGVGGPNEGGYGVGDPLGGNVALNSNGGAAMTPLTFRQLSNDLEVLMRVLKLFENKIQTLVHGIGQEGITRPGVFLLETLDSINVNDATMPMINGTIDLASELVQSMDMGGGGDMGRVGVHTTRGGGGGGHASTSALEHIQSCLNLAFSTKDPIGTTPGSPPAHKGYRVHLHMEKVWGGDKLPAPTLSFWCFIPGMAFRMLRHLRLRSILLTSGTLAPLEGFAHELQMPFEVRLQNPHIIKPSQVWVGVVPLGPSGHSLNSSYQSRDSVGYKEDLGNAVVNFARTIPDGLLVFFPSYSAMDSCISHWKGQGVGSGGAMGTGGGTWERIIRYKSPVIEPKDGSLFTAAIEEFKARLDDRSMGGGGAVFFAVCRGKVSEGLDFSDRAGRGVIITGIPFSNTNDPKVKIKRQVLDEEMRGQGLSRGQGSLSGEQWYVEQAMRAVNQAMGRVIRHRWDYGAIILADCRFEGEGLMKQTSRWLQEHVVKHPNFGQASASLTRFFRDKEGFQAPSDYGARQGSVSRPATGVGAFEFLGQGGGGGGGGLQGRPRVNIADLAPSAVDLSGLMSIRSGAGAGTALPPPSSGIHRRPQGLMGLLKQQETMPPPPVHFNPGPSAVNHSVAYQPSSHPQQSLQPPVSAAMRRSHDNSDPNELGGPGMALSREAAPDHLLALLYKDKAVPPAPPSSIPLNSLPISTLPPPLNPPLSQQPMAKRLTVGRMASTAAPQPPPPSHPAASEKAQGRVGEASISAPAQDGATHAVQPVTTSAKKQSAPEFIARLKSELSPSSFADISSILGRYKKDKDTQSLIEGATSLLKGPKTVHFLEELTDFLPKSERGWFSEVVKVHLEAARGIEQQKEPEKKDGPGQEQHKGGLKPPASSHPINASGGSRQPAAGPSASRPASVTSTSKPSIPPKSSARGASLKRTIQMSAQGSIGGLNGGQPGAIASSSLPLDFNAKRQKATTLGPAGEPCCICNKCPMEAPHQAPCKHSACYACWVTQVARYMRCKQCGAQVRKNQLAKSFFQP